MTYTQTQMTEQPVIMKGVNREPE